MSLSIKRVYDDPAPEDGRRILVDRLWPRGVSKERAALDRWMKEVAPSNELRKEVHAGKVSWDEFRARYGAELEAPEAQEALDQLRRWASEGTVTLLVSVRDREQNHAQVLREVLED
ncbi:MAG: DUF488 family protein [Acidobacteriota bacterium]|nr:DUF488 family protein [Acidobacteriota bacterium]